MISSVVARAKDLYADGNDLETIFSILKAQNINTKIIMAALKTTDDENFKNLIPPSNYDDIFYIIESTLDAYPAKEIVKILTAKTKFGQIMPLEHAKEFDLEYLIDFCQKEENNNVLDEIHNTLKPYMQKMIMHINMLSQYEQKFPFYNNYELKVLDRYIEWFGLWTPEMQLAYKEVLEGYDGNSEEIDVSYDYNNEEQTYCPMYKTEINVNNVCRSCPFFLEVFDEESDDVVKKCNFRK